MGEHDQISLQVPDTFSTIKTSDVNFEIDLTSVPSQILWDTEQKPRQVEEKGLFIGRRWAVRDGREVRGRV